MAAPGWLQALWKGKGELLFPRHLRISCVLCSPLSPGEMHALIATSRVQQQGVANDSILTPRYALQVLQRIAFAKPRLIVNHSCS